MIYPTNTYFGLMPNDAEIQKANEAYSKFLLNMPMAQRATVSKRTDAVEFIFDKCGSFICIVVKEFQKL